MVVLALCAVIVVVGFLRGHPFLPMLEIGISLAIAAVPEGLPAVATMTLAMGMQRMARMRALVRRLPAVETLGSTTVICTDKTGTLTRNEMTVCAYVLEGERIEVTGTGYATEGEFQRDGRPVDAKADDHLTLALRIGALCNDAAIELRDGQNAVLGDPTEGALIVAAAKAGLDRPALDRDYPRVGEVPFDSDVKRMITVHRTPEGRTVAYLKGGVAAVLDACRVPTRPGGPRPLGDEDRRRVIETNEELAAGALRVLALACRDLPDGYGEEDLARDYDLVGLVGMIDPLREEAKAAIATCRGAGIRVSMITGDQPATAAEIARQLGLDRDARGNPLKTVHARELEGLDEEGWARVAAESAVFARVSPEHKLRIVEGLRRRGHVVAMTGDGVNDAPALKAADIGIAMGIKGTEVAKETADMILTDDNFATIVGAVEQGRIVYANILKFVHYLFSCNLAEILVVFAAIMLGWPMPLGALQILWLNLITDVFPAMALALEPSAPDMMKRPPRDPAEKLLNPRFVGLIAWQGLLLAAATLVAFRVGLDRHGSEGRGPAPGGDDGLHDAGPGPGRTRLQRAVAAADRVHEPPVHERLAVGGRARLRPPPGGRGLRAAAPAGAAYRPAEPVGLGRHHLLFPGPRRRRGDRQARRCGGTGPDKGACCPRDSGPRTFACMFVKRRSGGLTVSAHHSRGDVSIPREWDAGPDASSVAAQVHHHRVQPSLLQKYALRTAIT